VSRQGDARQLVLALRHVPAAGREDFLVSGSNAEAAAWVDRWPDWPIGAPGLNLHGPEGAGKSHLAAVWAGAAGALTIDPHTLDPDGVRDRLGDAGHVVLDPFDELVDGVAVLHLYNTVAEREGAVLILSRTPLARLALGPADLLSRLSALPAVRIGPPDDALLVGIMAKQFRDRQVAVEPAVLGFLARRMERSFAAAGRLVDRLDRLSLSEGRRITTAQARRALAEAGVGHQEG
jgi:chromosomal replication initiation ATPase DnaA